MTVIIPYARTTSRSFHSLALAAQAKFWDRRLMRNQRMDAWANVSGNITDKLSARRRAARLADADTRVQHGDYP